MGSLSVCQTGMLVNNRGAEGFGLPSENTLSGNAATFDCRMLQFGSAPSFESTRNRVNCGHGKQELTKTRSKKAAQEESRSDSR